MRSPPGTGRRREPSGDARPKAETIRAAAQHTYPTAEVDAMLEEIERGYSSGPASPVPVSGADTARSSTDGSVFARARDWLFTIPFLLAFGLTLLVFDVFQRLALPFGRRPHEVVVGMLQASLVACLRICGTRFLVERGAELPRGRPYLFVTNHQSMFDIPILGTFLKHHYPKFVSKRELAQRWIPSISFNLRHGGNALIDRSNRTTALSAIRHLGEAEVTGRGVSAVMYPEGTRARTGVLGPFKPQGTFELMAAAPQAAVVPVALDGPWMIVRDRLRPIPFGTRVRVSIGEPIERRPDEDPAEVLTTVRRHVEDALARWRGQFSS